MNSNENNAKSVISEFLYHKEWITHSKKKNKFPFQLDSPFNFIIVLIFFLLLFCCFGGWGVGGMGGFHWLVWLFCFPQIYTLSLAEGLYPKYNYLVGWCKRQFTPLSTFVYRDTNAMKLFNLKSTNPSFP